MLNHPLQSLRTFGAHSYSGVLDGKLEDLLIVQDDLGNAQTNAPLLHVLNRVVQQIHQNLPYFIDVAIQHVIVLQTDIQIEGYAADMHNGIKDLANLLEQVLYVKGTEDRLKIA